MQKIIFAIGAVVVLSTTYTMAQQGESIREECAADIRAACGDVAPGGIRSCLNSHLADLTRPCQAVLVSVAAVANALTVGFGLWFFGFMVIAGEYFAMWQSKVWNGQDAAARIATVILGALIFVNLPDGESD